MNLGVVRSNRTRVISTSMSLSIHKVYHALCVKDQRYPLYNQIHDIETDGPPIPRIDCACDNCFYGRDPLAIEILRLFRKQQMTEKEQQEIGSEAKTQEPSHAVIATPCMIDGVPHMKIRNDWGVKDDASKTETFTFIGIRQDLVTQVDHAINVVRELVKQLNDNEKKYLQLNSVAYSKLVNGIAAWSKQQTK